MTNLDTTKARYGTMPDGNGMFYYPIESMALPAEIVTVENGYSKTTRYDSRLYALAVFAQETEDKALLTAVQDAELESCDCADCEGDN